MKVHRFDNGGEYTSDSLCKEAQIKRELTITYNPWKNGVADKKSIVETSKAMVRDLDLSMFLWEMACSTVVYILNRCSHVILKEKTLAEACNSEKPHVSHFHIFSCPIYIRIPKEKRIK
jgi:hypothetical protein